MGDVLDVAKRVEDDEDQLYNQDHQQHYTEDVGPKLEQRLTLIFVPISPLPRYPVENEQTSFVQHDTCVTDLAYEWSHDRYVQEGGYLECHHYGKSYVLLPWDQKHKEWEHYPPQIHLPQVEVMHKVDSSIVIEEYEKPGVWWILPRLNISIIQDS